MWPAIYNFAGTAFSVMCCCAAVKLADDYLDYDLDQHAGRTNFVDFFGRGTMLYSMLCLVVAAAINPEVSLSLFLSCYIVGMFNHLNSRFPSRLSGLQESLLVFALGVVIWGLEMMVFSILFIICMQLVDDCIDVYSDQMSGYRNFAHRFGVAECLLAAVLCLIGCWRLNSEILGPIVVGTVTFYLGILKIQGVRT